MQKSDRIYISGHKGMVGSALLRLLKKEGYEHLVTADKTSLNLLDQSGVEAFFALHKPEIVVVAAARVGGIKANMESPADFLFENLQIQNNLIHSSYLHKVKKVIFLGSSCIYPKDCPQPMKENYLLTGPLEPTNEGYALAKIAGLKMLEYYRKQYGLQSISLMPCNLYGPNDSFDLEKSHVLSALVRKFTDAEASRTPSVTLWGSGVAHREFMHVDDLARAIVFFADKETAGPFINVGVGEDLTIKELAQLIAKETGYSGDIHWDTSKPNGMLRKCMDIQQMKSYGFFPEVMLKEGISQMIQIYKNTLRVEAKK